MAYILIVDDDKDLNEAIADVLRNSGHEVTCYLDTQSGFKSLDERIPDLLILDIMFPDDVAAGFTFVRDLNVRFKGKNKFPILMVSSKDDYYHPEIGARDIDAQWMPVTDFMQKPVDFKILKDKVAELLANSKDAPL